MTNEEFERLKEEEKAHLREIRKLRSMAKQLRVKRSVQAALDRMMKGSQEVLDTHDEMVRQLAVETARAEARFDVAMEQREQDHPIQDLDDLALKARAKELLERMTEPSKSPANDTASTAPPSSREPERTSNPSSDASDAAPAPRKTLGRPRT